MVEEPTGISIFLGVHGKIWWTWYTLVNEGELLLRREYRVKVSLLLFFLVLDRTAKGDGNVINEYWSDDGWNLCRGYFIMRVLWCFAPSSSSFSMYNLWQILHGWEELNIYIYMRTYDHRIRALKILLNNIKIQVRLIANCKVFTDYKKKN